MTVFRKTEDGWVELEPLPPRIVTPAKLRAFRKALDLGGPSGRLSFKNGSKVRVERRIVVEGAIGGRSVFVADVPGEVERAYVMALYGAARIAQPKGDPAKFGDEAPW